MNLSKQENLIEFCSNETIIRLDGKNYSLVKNNDTKYEYNTRYGNNDLILKQEFSGTLSIDANENLNVDNINKIFGIDESKMPDSYDMKVPYRLPCRRHKKKRINKKWTKKYGQNYVITYKIVKGWKLNNHTDGTFEFVKDGES